MSLLSALLTQDQVVSAARIDEAIQRQVILGGDFETNLLELNAIGEDTLTAYCAAIYGLGPGTRDDVLEADPTVTARVPRVLAERLRAVALRGDGGAVVVIVDKPLDASARAELEALLGRPVSQRVVTSFRLAWALWRYHQVPLSPRFSRLSQKIHGQPSGHVPTISQAAVRPVTSSSTSANTAVRNTLDRLDALLREDDSKSGPPSAPPPPPGIPAPVLPAPAPLPVLAAPEPAAPAVTERRSSRPPPATPAPERRSSRPPAVTPLNPFRGNTRPVHTVRSDGPEPNAPQPFRTQSPMVVQPPQAITREFSQALSSRPHAVAAAVTGRIPAGDTSSAPTVPPPAPVPQLRPIASQPAPAAEPDVRTMPPAEMAPALAEALTRVARASDRDAVIDILVAQAASQFEYAALFVVHGETFSGLVSRGRGASTASLRARSMTFDGAAAFRAARDTAEPQRLRVQPATGEAVLRGELQRAEAAEVMLVPIRIRGRCALILWLDAGAKPLDIDVTQGFVRFADECGQAFTRLILERKRSSAPPKSITIPPTRPTPAPMTSSPSARPSRPSVESRAAALRSVLQPARPGTLPPATREPLRPVPPAAPVDGARARGASPELELERMVAEVAQTGVLPERTTASLLGMGDRALDVIFRYFPGPHVLTRAEVPARLPVMSDSGPLLRLVVTFRQMAVPRLILCLDDADPDRRFCALLCLGELAHPSSVPALTLRLTDPDLVTRKVAVEVMKNHRRFAEYAHAPESLRRLVSDVATEMLTRRYAIEAIAELRDAASVELLIPWLECADRDTADAARAGLVVLTRQDFGDDLAAWGAWWSTARAKHRVEWLIESLLHGEPTIRHDASEELKKLTGQFIGYYYNLPRRERERAHQRYVEWWKREGAERFPARGAGATG